MIACSDKLTLLFYKIGECSGLEIGCVLSG